MYGGAEGHYPYGNELFVYNVRHKVLTVLRSKEAAAGYLQAMNPTGTAVVRHLTMGTERKSFSLFNVEMSTPEVPGLWNTK